VRGAVCEVDWETVAPGLVVTASLGLADSSWKEGPHDVYRLADARLYAAKAGGRNRVEFKSMTADASLATLH
jgi:PleD family two-component response regulator